MNSVSQSLEEFPKEVGSILLVSAISTVLFIAKTMAIEKYEVDVKREAARGLIFGLGTYFAYKIFKYTS